MSRNAFHARSAADASASYRRTPTHAARPRTRGTDARAGARAPSPEHPDAGRPPAGAEPVPQADGHP